MTTETKTDFEKIAGVLCVTCLGKKRIGVPAPIAVVNNTPMDCPTCQGTGRRFSWLWWECPGDTHRRIPPRCERFDGQVTHVYSPSCNGEGWLLIEAEGDQLLGLLRVVLESGLYIECWDKDGVWIQDVAMKLREPVYGHSLASALVKALGLE